MKIFISHSTKDKKLLKGLKQSLEPHGLILLIAEHCSDLTRSTSQKIEGMINECDIALVLLTEHGFNSTFVQQEIGYIRKADKPLLQVVQKGIERKISGFNFGHDYISLDMTSKDKAIERVRNTLLDHWSNLEEEKRKKQIELVQQQELDRQRSSAIISIGLLAVVIILVLVLSGEK